MYVLWNLMDLYVLYIHFSGWNFGIWHVHFPQIGLWSNNHIEGFRKKKLHTLIRIHIFWLVVKNHIVYFGGVFKQV